MLVCVLLKALGSSFAVAIAYSIRGQLAWHQRTYAFRLSLLIIIILIYQCYYASLLLSNFVRTLLIIAYY